MLDFIRNWIINITVVMIFIMLLETILPNSDMKRYVNVVVGLLIVVVIIQPLMLVKDISLQFNKNVLEATAFVQQGSVAAQAVDLNRYRKQEALQLFEARIKGEIGRLLEQEGIKNDNARIELELATDIDQQDFGRIRSVDIYLDGGDSSAIEVNKINVSISKVDDGDDNKSVMNKDNGEYNFSDNSLTSKLKNSISKALGVEESAVSIRAK